MSKDTIERQLDVIIFLLENLPRKICDEMDVREEVKRYKEREQLLEEREKILLDRESKINANNKMVNNNARI